MVHYSAVGFLAFVLCLVAFLSANADGNNAQQQDSDVTIDQAQKAVEETKKSIKEVSDKAQDNIGNATIVLNLVKALKTKAEDAAAEAQKAPKDNPKATLIVEDIKRIFSQMSTFHLTAEKDLQNAIDSMNAVLTETQTLNGECNIEITSKSDPATNYKDAKNKALDIQAKAVLLNTNTSDALRVINGVHSTAVEMEQKAKDAELKKLQVSGIVAGTELETTIGEADSIFETINNKKEEVNGIVQEMKKRSTNAHTDLIESINGLLQRVDIELRNANGAFDKATKAKADMTQQKETADAALKKVEKTTEVNETQTEVRKALACIDEVKNIVRQLKIELTAAKNSVINANVSKQEMETALSKSTGAPSTEEIKETEKSDHPVQKGTKPDQNDTTIHPTTTNTEKATRNEPLNQGGNSADKLKDTVNKGAQNVPKTALTGEKVPAPGANNDSAMTVSVPLLVALIASAVWK